MRETVDESVETIRVDLYNLYFTWYLAHISCLYQKTRERRRSPAPGDPAHGRDSPTFDLSKTRLRYIST